MTSFLFLVLLWVSIKDASAPSGMYLSRNGLPADTLPHDPPQRGRPSLCRPVAFVMSDPFRIPRSWRIRLTPVGRQLVGKSVERRVRCAAWEAQGISGPWVLRWVKLYCFLQLTKKIRFFTYLLIVFIYFFISLFRNFIYFGTDETSTCHHIFCSHSSYDARHFEHLIYISIPQNCTADMSDKKIRGRNGEIRITAELIGR